MVLWEKLGAHRRWMIGAGLLLVVLACYFAWHGWQAHEAAARQAQKPPTAIPVKVVAVRTADFPVYLKGLGTVQPFDTVTVKSRVDGQVIKVAFKQGDMVKEGDILIQIDPKPYQAALDQALAKKAQDEANLKNAETNLERYGDLAKRDFASRQQVDTQQASVDQLTAQLKGDEAMIDSAQTQLDYATIRSPLTGRTGFRLVDPGNIVHANDTTGMVSIVRMQPISVVFTAPEENVPDVNKALANGDRAGRCADVRRKAGLVEGQARPREQRSRPGKRHDPHEGQLRQQRQRAVARPLGDHAHPGADGEERHRRGAGRHPAWPERIVRVRRRPGQQGRSPRRSRSPNRTARMPS